MKIRGWSIDGFGVFHGRSRSGLSTGCTLIYGPNETGKSTLLAFVRTMLMGFPQRERAKFYPPLAGGRHGGKLQVETSDGVWTIERYASPLTMKVTDPSGRVASETELRKLLGNITPSVFQAIFAFTLSELQDFESFHSEEVRERLFAGTVSGAGPSPREAITDLQAEQEKLYKPRSKSGLINVLADKLKLKEQEYIQAQAQAREFPQLFERHQKIEKDLKDTQLKLQEMKRRQEQMELLLQLWPVWLEIQDLREQKNQLKNVPQLNEADETNWRALQLEHRELEARLADAKRRLERSEQEVRAIQVDVSFLNKGPGLKALAQDLPSIERIQRRLAELDQQRARTRLEVDQELVHLGEDFSLDRVARFDLTLVRREEVRQWAEQLQECERLTGSRRDRMDEFASRELPLQESLSDLHSLLQLRDFLLQKPLLAQRLLRTQWGALGAFGLGLVVGGISLFASEQKTLGLSLGGIAFAIALGLGVLWVQTRKTIAALQQKLVESVRAAGLEVSLNDIDVRSLETRIESVRESERRGKESESIQRLIAEAEAQETAQRQEWEKWKLERELPLALSPDGVLELFQQINATQQKIVNLRQIESEIRSLESEVTAWKEKSKELLGNASEKEKLFGELARLETEEKQQLRQRELQRQLKDLEIERDSLSGQLQAKVAEKTAWNLRLHVDSAAGVDAAFIRSKQLIQIQEKLADRERTLRVQLGDGIIAESVVRELEQGEVQRWRDDLGFIKDEMELSLKDRDRWVGAAKEVELAEKKLLQSADVVQLGNEVESIRAELDEALAEFATLKLAEELTTETLAEYEQKNQPQVLADAGKLFTQVTANRYRRIIQREQELFVLDQDGSSKRVDELSRGTGEQLYLCLRLGLVADFARRETSLPVIMDDVLVNSDPARAAQMIRVLGEVAQDQQILFFTCHPWVRDLFQQELKSATIVDLSDSGSGAQTGDLPLFS